MSDDATKPHTQPYDKPAGGWDALRSSARELIRHRIAAKGAITLLSANQADGFDCPGCAWPDRDHRSTFEFCENGVKAVASEATAARATPEVIAQHTLSEYERMSDHALEAMGRLTHPLRYDPATDRYQPVSWDEAFALIGRTLQGLASPDEAAFYTSGRTSNEAAFLYQLFVREYGTNNFPDCSNMCHEPSGVALKAAVGTGKGTVTLADFEHADAIFVFGQNPGTNHPRMLGELRSASRRGAAIVSFNPLRERGLERFADPKSPVEMATLGSTPISSHYFRPRIGGDLAALSGMCKRLQELDDEAVKLGRERVIDEAFIAQHCEGYEAFAQSLRALAWDEIVARSGLSLEDIHSATAVYARAGRVIACWGMGITQHRRSVDTIRMIANWLLMRGNIGRTGAGLCPVRGHSNVQGDRTMGIDHHPPASLLDRLDAEFGIASPRGAGLDTVGTIAAMRDGRVKVLFGMGGNFAAATPDTEATHAAIRRCELTVHVATKFNRSHVVHGAQALVLPCLGRTEIDLQGGRPQAVSVEDSMSMVHLSRGINPPVSDALLSETQIVARLARATLPASRIDWAHLAADHDRIRDRIEAVFEGFEQFNQRLAQPGGFRLRNAASHREWRTASGKAQFAPARFEDPLPQAAPGVFSLATMRSHDQYNTTVYGLDDRYRGVHGQRQVLFIHAADIEALGLAPGDRVDIETVSDDGVQRRVSGFALVPYDIPRGCLAAYYPETNPLVPLGNVAIGAGTPASKSVPVRLTAHRPAP